MIDEKKLKAGVIVKMIGNKTATIQKNWSKKYPKYVTALVKDEKSSRQINVLDIEEITECKNFTNIVKNSKASLCSYKKV